MTRRRTPVPDPAPVTRRRNPTSNLITVDELLIGHAPVRLTDGQIDPGQLRDLAAAQDAAAKRAAELAAAASGDTAAALQQISANLADAAFALRSVARHLDARPG